MFDTIVHLGKIPVRSYSVMLTVAFVVGTFVAVSRAKEYGVETRAIVSIVNFIIIGSFVGSRLLGILENYQYYYNYPKGIFSFGQGGYSFYGGLLLSFVLVYLYVKKSRVPLGAILDIFAPSIALGFFLVRIGCFLNGCCFGTPTNLPWGIAFPLHSPAGSIFANVPIHPTQLYEASAGAATFVALLFLDGYPRIKRKQGLLFSIFILSEGTWRYVIEHYRYHDSHFTAAVGISPAQIYSIGCMVLSIFMILRMCRLKSEI